MSPQLSAVLYAKDLPRAVAFYVAVAGLTADPVGPDDDFRVLRAPGVELVIVAIPAVIADGISITVPPARREDTAIKLVFPVASIAAARAAAAAHGGALNGPDREWSFAGARVCDGHDPEGNVLQLREPIA